MATWCKEVTPWKRPEFWKRFRGGGEGDNRGCSGCMSSPPQWTWVWTSFRSWWWTERPGVLPSMEVANIQRRLNWTELKKRRCAGENLYFSFLKWNSFIFETVATVVAKRHSSLSLRLSHSSTWAYLHRGVWGPSRPEMELMSPALVGVFLSTEPPAEAWDFISWLCRWWKNCALWKLIELCIPQRCI